MKKILLVMIFLLSFSFLWASSIKKTTFILNVNTNNFDVQKFIDSQDLTKCEWEESSFEELWDYQFEWAKEGRNYPMWKGKNFISKSAWFEDYIVLRVIMILEDDMELNNNEKDL